MKTISTFCLLVLAHFAGMAQSPLAFNYQAVLRSTDGAPIINNDIGLKISILSDTVQNIVHYAEIQDVTTDSYGRINLKIGTGDILLGSFSGINWEDGNYFIRIEFDDSGGTNYQLAGQTQLLSVPYALYSSQSGNSFMAGEGIDIDEDVISNTGDLSAANELQTLTKLGNTVVLSQGGGAITDSDNQSLNVISVGTSRQIQISGGNSVTIEVADNDNQPENEIQVISISNDTIYLSNGGYVKLPIPTSAIVPPGGCIQSLSPEPPPGYFYSGTGITAGDLWNDLPPMTYSRFGAAVATVNNKIYVFGGWDGVSSVSNVVEVFDLDNQTWEKKSNMPTAVVYAAAAVIGSSIHVLGGYNGNTIVNRHQVYNTLNNSWSLATNLPQARSGCGAAVVSGKIYLIGGFFNNTALNTNQMYDPVTSAWVDKAPMTTARTDFATAQTNDGIYAIGGWNQDVLNVNEFYNPTADTWTTYYSTSYYRSGCSGAVVNNKIYVLGGGTLYNYNSITEEYYPLTNEWKTKTSMPSPRSFFGAIGIDDKIYIVGGNFGEALKSIMVYDPATTQYYIHCSQ
ncbi:MAG: hypothetical protein IH598_08100 [Bacteroidales bacterium]|nr:hypothetical protein [Bacteroidales bacterium]